MTLKEAIERYTNNADYESIYGSMRECLDFRQLAEWLKDYKRLLEQETKNNPQPSEHFIDGAHAIGYREGYKDAQKQKSRKWIPVSERLPEESDCCLCCDKDGYVTIGGISKWLKEWYFDDDEVDMDVVAWMPLPEPYKEGSENKE